jgi:acetylornithine deacetylase/succinyl-diaminopimelate desuccinylase-like protein
VVGANLPCARALLLALVLGACRPSAVVLPPRPERGSGVEAEAAALLAEYLRIDTTNPPGNEARAAAFLRRVLEREGIEVSVFDLGRNRANLIAVLRGDGSRRPVVLLHHMDVVPAEAKYWRHPPFSGAVEGGEIYGRGAIDIKGKGIIDLVTVLRLKRRGAPRLRRDIVLLAVADEEAGSLGARWIVEKRPDLLRGAEFLLDEGESIRVDPASGRVTYLFSFAEKSPLWLRVVFSGKAGHGSLPVRGSSVERAVRAAARVLEHRTAPRLTRELRAWVRRRLEGRDRGRVPGLGAAEDLDAALERPEFLEAIAETDPELGASLRDTVALTVLKGSDRVNTIPNEASFELDCRLLPGTRARDKIEELRAVLGDPAARIEVLESGQARSSSTDTELVRALRAVAARRDPGAAVIPTLLLSSTDSSAFRALGIAAYGFEPYKLTEAEADLSHAQDERISTRNLALGVELLTDLLLELDGPRDGG